MSYKTLLEICGIDRNNREQLEGFAQQTEIPIDRLLYYTDHRLIPSDPDLTRILTTSGKSHAEVLLQMGKIDGALLQAIAADSVILQRLSAVGPSRSFAPRLAPAFETQQGQLYQADCLDFLRQVETESVDVVFADPPFNLNKSYQSQINDDRDQADYLDWCFQWLDECIRVLKQGGSLLVWHLPYYNTLLANHIKNHLTFKHWIAVDIKYSLPIKGRLYPSHYSLIYFTKGSRANTFSPDRLPMQTCRHCFNEIKDYGGYKAKMNPAGINLSDVWTDISPVRHSKYKKRASANELPLKLLDRIIEMSSKEGDVILDPFGGSGTTFAAAELKNRKWLGCELGPIEDIVSRFSHLQEDAEHLKKIRDGINSLFPADIKAQRKARGIWTDDDFSNKTAPLTSQTMPPQKTVKLKNATATGLWPEND